MSQDTNKNLDRIVNTLLNDPAVFDSGKTTGLARSIHIYDPANQIENSEIMPYIYVTTTDSLLESTRDTPISSSDSLPPNTVEYKIVIVATGKPTLQEGQKNMYDILKFTRDSLEADPKFPEPGNPGVDEVFSRSIVSDVTRKHKKETTITTTTIILLATIGEEFSITLPSIGIIPLLSQPSNLEGVSFQDNYTQNGSTINRVITKGKDFGTLLVEYESTEALNSQLRAKIFSTIAESVTLNVGTPNERALTVEYMDINPNIPQFDSIPRSILHMEIKTHW